MFRVCLPVLFAEWVWKIIGHLGGFNGAALMESFSCTALHFITSVCQLYLIYKVSKRQRMWSINLRVGDCTRERGDGRIYHSLTWPDVLQLSLVEFEWVISVITLIRNDLSQVYCLCVQECAQAFVTFIRRCTLVRLFQSHCASVQVELIAHHSGLSEVCWHRWFVFTPGPI